MQLQIYHNKSRLSRVNAKYLFLVGNVEPFHGLCYISFVPAQVRSEKILLIILISRLQKALKEVEVVADASAVN